MFQKINENNFNHGFTLLELMVSIAIMAILSATLFGISRNQDDLLKLKEASIILAQDIKEVEELTMAAKPILCTKGPYAGTYTYNYGIHFKAVKGSYTIFGDCNNDHKYTGLDEDLDIKTVYFDEVEIISVDPVPAASVVFDAPRPTVYIKKLDNPSDKYTDMVITLALKSDNTKTKVVKVNLARRIEVL